MNAQRLSLRFVVAALLAISCASVNAVITTISRQGTDVVLSWPSTPGQKFIVQFRDSLNPGSSWCTLTNGLTAAAGTNVTTFVHAGVLPEGGEQMQSSAGATAANARLSPEELADLWAKRKAEAEATIAWLTAQLYEAAAKAKAWREEVAKNPGLLEEARKRAAETQLANLDSGSGCCGFYRVFIPSPVAKADVFGVAQNSVTNQLSILANDDDPEEYFFQISDVTSAGHGTIQYNDSGSIFRYTPTSGFSGTDSFTYSVTNEVGGLAGTTAWVFVNQSGNQHPAAAPLTFTLSSNMTQISFSILTNASDPDTDPLSFALLLPPSKGTAVTNGDGTLTYARTSEVPARDEFFYVLTDGRGGFTKRTVILLQQDSDSDGMPDEWEAANNLNPAANDLQGDPDGDGLPNLAEYKLATDPQVADNPLNLQLVSSGQAFSGYGRVYLPLSPKIDSPAITLRLNGQGAHSFMQQGADGSWYLSWDTGYLANGNYSIALSFLYNPNAQPPTPVSVVGQAKSVQVTNEVIFNQLNSEFTDLWFIDVTFPYQNADFRIELYDADGSGLVYFEGATTDGNVQGWWDLTIEGQQISFSHIRADVFVAPSGGQGMAPAALPSTPSARRWFVKQVAGGVGDTFVVAWGWDNYSSSFEQRRTDLMLDGVINIIGDPSRPDEYQLRPGVNVPYANAFRFDDSFDRTVLMDALSASDSGNFFWFGHGGTSAITGNGDKASIGTLDLEEALKNKKHRSKPPMLVFANEHPYRLVILNACETYDAGWAHAFGIDYSPNGTTNDVLAYYRQGRQPQAFLGWDENIQVPISGADFLGHGYYATALAYLFANWMEGYLLEEGLRQYSDYLYVLGYSGHRSWKISGTASLYRGAP